MMIIKRALDSVTPEFTGVWIDQLKDLRLWIKQLISQ